MEGNHGVKTCRCCGAEETSSGKPIPEGSARRRSRHDRARCVHVGRRRLCLAPTTRSTPSAPEGEGEGTLSAQGGITRFEVLGHLGRRSPSARHCQRGTVRPRAARRPARTRSRFEIVGAEPHHIIALPMTPWGDDRRRDQVLQDREGQAADRLRADPGTSVTDGGTTENLELELKSGKYALPCFITDRAGGLPHGAKGRSRRRPSST